VDRKGLALLELSTLALASFGYVGEEDRWDRFIAEVLPRIKVDQLVREVDLPSLTQSWGEVWMGAELEREGIVEQEEEGCPTLNRFFLTLFREVRTYLDEAKVKE